MAALYPAGRAPPLPPWTSGMCLMEFLPATAEAVQAAVDAAAAARSARHALFHAISGLAGAPLFCDTADWWWAVLLLPVGSETVRQALALACRLSSS